MKACKACNIKVSTKLGFCPLCGTELVPENETDGFTIKTHNSYPNLSKETLRFNLLKRVLLFLTFLSSGVCLMVNLLVDSNFLWSVIVIASLAYCWLTIPPLLRRGVNFGFQIVVLVVLTTGLAVLLDFIIGYTGWSLNYVLPSLLSAGILVTSIMPLFSRTSWAQIVLYQTIIGVFGFAPLLLYLLGLTSSLVMALITAALALASLLITIVFGDRSIKSEFKRRFHF